MAEMAVAAPAADAIVVTVRLEPASPWAESAAPRSRSTPAESSSVRS